MLATYGERFGLDRETAYKVAGAFGGGMARMGETCGAITGGLMVIGLQYGKTRAGDDEAREMAYELANEFVSRFKKRNQSVLCRDLLGYDLGTETGREMAAEENLFETRCPRFVQDAGNILEELL